MVEKYEIRKRGKFLKADSVRRVADSVGPVFWAKGSKVLIIDE
jgi:hypothetical protein